MKKDKVGEIRTTATCQQRVVRRAKVAAADTSSSASSADGVLCCLCNWVAVAVSTPQVRKSSIMGKAMLTKQESDYQAVTQSLGH